MSHKLIHIARIQPKGKKVVYLFLRKVADGEYIWFQEEAETPVKGNTVEEAIRQAHRYWKDRDEAFRAVICGFRYTLPERDEHGDNALFHQMVASYSSFNGIYFDEELGHNCIVHNASQEALKLMDKWT